MKIKSISLEIKLFQSQINYQTILNYFFDNRNCVAESFNAKIKRLNHSCFRCLNMGATWASYYYTYFYRSLQGFQTIHMDRSLFWITNFDPKVYLYNAFAWIIFSKLSTLVKGFKRKNILYNCSVWSEGLTTLFGMGDPATVFPIRGYNCFGQSLL
jgi:hypothetical protein